MNDTTATPPATRAPHDDRADHAELAVLDPGPWRRLAVRGVAAIGSAPECEVRLRVPGVAPRHAELRWDGLRWIVRPLAPGAGFAVNGHASTWAILRDRDVLTVAAYTFGFRAGPRSAARPALVGPAPEDLAAAAAALADERRAWERQLAAARTATVLRERQLRERVARSADHLRHERAALAAAERAVVRRAAELDRLAERLAGRERELARERFDNRYDRRQLDERFAELGAERRQRLRELAALEGMIDAARERLAATRVELARANRFGSPQAVPAPRAEEPRRALVWAPAWADGPSAAGASAEAWDEADEAEEAGAAAGNAEPRPGLTVRWPAGTAEPPRAIPAWLADAAALAARERDELHAARHAAEEARRHAAARAAELAAREAQFDRDAAAEHARLRLERDAVDRRRLWLDRAAERWAALRAGGGAEDVRREWARMRGDVLAERVELLCERDRLAAAEEELPRLRRLVAKQRRLLARAHEELSAARASWDAERVARAEEAAALQETLENLVAAYLTELAARPAADVRPPALRLAA